MKGRDQNKGGLGGATSADLLVCFPSRAHLTLMPKAICSPSRSSSESNKRHVNHHHHLKKINTSRLGGGVGPASPLMWAKGKRGGNQEDISSEPTSPKVTCAGQIKVRPRSACRNWQSVMEEIERIHSRSKLKKKSSWTDALGFKKDVTNFLTCLRNVRFDFRCFGAFPEQEISSDDEEEEDEEEEEEEDDEFRDVVDEEGSDAGNNNNNTVFSKWFMVLQENQQGTFDSTIIGKDMAKDGKELEDDETAPAVPPPNALLLMRCRSAPCKSWLEGQGKGAVKNKSDDQNEQGTDEEQQQHTATVLVEEEEEGKEYVDEEEAENKEHKKKRETLAILMKYDVDFYKLSGDVAQETWVVGGFKDSFCRSRSWKR